jgi:hypothetical protein
MTIWTAIERQTGDVTSVGRSAARTTTDIATPDRINGSDALLDT